MSSLDEVIYTVRIRRNLGFEVKPEAEQLEGKTYKFLYGWEVDEMDSRYSGETIYLPHDENYPLDAPSWIASGDLVASNDNAFCEINKDK